MGIGGGIVFGAGTAFEGGTVVLDVRGGTMVDVNIACGDESIIACGEAGLPLSKEMAGVDDVAVFLTARSRTS
jgi:hypothetical protein